MAEAIFKSMVKDRALDIEVKSCGTRALLGMSATKEAIEVLKREGINILDHRSKQLSQELIEWSDLILVMETRHKEELLEYSSSRFKDKVFLLTDFAKEGSGDIVDPIAKPLEVYEGLVMNLKFYLTRIIERIENENIFGQ
jgi:protein arginine phosphatase